MSAASTHTNMYANTENIMTVSNFCLCAAIFWDKLHGPSVKPRGDDGLQL